MDPISHLGEEFDRVGLLARTVADLSLFDMALTGDHRRPVRQHP
jgi:Asp-tRNA(Asn)/Glu-tRNA(Gln) amidotransferase A subunit family amidase